MEVRFPKYLSAPVQVLWFEPDDLGILLFSFTLALIFGGLCWLLLFLLPYLYSRFKRKYPKSFFKHLLYFSGVKTPEKYPTAFEKRFLE